MANRYWVAGFSNDWSDTSNWSTTSGGIGGSSVPGSSDDAIFDSNSANHNCTLDQNVNVNSWIIGSYSGTVDCVTFDVTTAGNFGGRTGTYLYMGTGTFTIGGDFGGRDNRLYGQTATLRFTTASGSFSLSNRQQDNGPFVEIASGATCVFGFAGNRKIRGLDCYGQFDFGGTYNQLDVYGDVTVRSTGSLIAASSSSQFTMRSHSTFTLEAGASVDSVRFATFRANPSTNSSVTFSGAGWATATQARISLSFLSTTVGRMTYVFPSVMHVRELDFVPRYSSSQATLDFATNSTQLTIGTSFFYNSTYTSDNFNINVGSSTLTFGLEEDSTFSPRGNTFPPIIISDNAVGTLTLDSNVTTPYVHDCANQLNENGYTVTTTGTDPSPCSTGSRYWVGLVDSDYENSGNWSTSSGGLGNASVPVATNDVVFDSGSSVNCTMSASRAAASFDAQSGYGGAIDFAANNMRCFGNFTLDHGGGMDFGSGTHYMGGFFDVKDCGTLDYATSSVELAGTGINMLTWSDTDTNKSFYDVIVSGNLTTQNVPYSAVRATNSYTISGTLTHNATSGARMTTANACPMVVSGTLTGVGTCAVSTTASGAASLTISGSGSVTISKLAMGLGGVTGSYVELGAGDYSGCDVEMSTSNSSSDAPLRFSGNVTLKSLNFTTSSGANMVVQNSTHNPSITLKGDLTCTTSNVTWSAGNGTIIFDNSGSQSVNFNGQTVEGIHVTDASTGSIVLASSFSTAWLRDCDSLIDLNGYTITNADSVDRCVYPYDPPTTIALDSAAAINVDQQLWLPMLEVSGTTTPDLSGNSNDGTLDAGLSHTVTTLGGAISFPENGGIDSSATISSQPYSVSLWGYINSATTYYYQMFIGQTSGSRPTIYIDNSSLLKMYGGSNTLSSTTTIGVGEWFHVVGVFDGSYSALYVNGAVEASGAVGPYDLSGGMRIGHWWTGGRDFDGNMQNVRVWSRALSSSEVSSLHSDPWIGSDYTAVVPPSNRYFSPAAFARLG